MVRLRRWLATGALVGLACYVALLVAHLATFETIAYGVPNIAGWAGRYPGYGWTWELTAINLPADLISRVPPLYGSWVFRVVPQAVTGHRVHFDEPKRWSATTWIVTGAAGYGLAGLGLGALLGVGAALRRRFLPASKMAPWNGHAC